MFNQHKTKNLVTLWPAGQFGWTGPFSLFIRKVCAPWKSYFEFWVFLSSNTCLAVVIDVSQDEVLIFSALCLGVGFCEWVCVWRCTHHPESSAGKGTVHSSCVQVSWPDLFIYIHLHAVKRSRRWQPPEPTVFLDPGPILSAWIRGTVKARRWHRLTASTESSGGHDIVDRRQPHTSNLQMSQSEDKIYRHAYVFVYSNAKNNCRPINIAHVRLTTRDIMVSSLFRYCGDKNVSIFVWAYDVSNNRSFMLKV